MANNTHTTFLLFCLAVVSAVFIWWFERTPALSRDESYSGANALIPFDLDTVDYLGIQQGGGYLECHRSSKEWELTQPVSARADSAKIDKILSALERLPKGLPITAAERSARGLTLKDYGLDKPQAIVVLRDKTHRWLLRVGGTSPLKSATYVRLDAEDEVWTTSTNLLEQLPSEAADMRDRRLLRGDPASVSRLEIKRSDGPASLIARSANEWVFQKPVVARADAAKVTEILERLFALEIRVFVSETMSDPVTYGIDADEAALQILVWRNGNVNGEKILFGKTLMDNPALVYASVKGASSVYAVPRDMADALGVSFMNLREKRLYFMDEQAVRQIRIVDDKRVLALELSPGGWQITEPGKWKADELVVKGMLTALNQIEITRFVDDSFTNAINAGVASGSILFSAAIPVAPGAPSVPVPASGVAPLPAAAATAERCLTWRLKDDVILAHFNDDPQCFELAGNRKNMFSPDTLFYRDRTVLSLDPASVRRIRIETDDGAQSVERNAAGGAWKSLVPGQGLVNGRLVDVVLGLSSNLKAIRFEPSERKQSEMFGLPGGCLSLTLGLTGEEGIQKTIVFGNLDGDEGVYAAVQGQDTVFVLRIEVLELLLNDLVRN